MNDVYDVIDTLRQKKHLSMRKLATLADIPYTTFTSFMTRRPATIAKSYLEAIAKVLSIEWTDLVSDAEAERASEEGRTKISTVLTTDEKEYILHNLFNDNPRLTGEAMLRRPVRAYDEAVQRLTANRPHLSQMNGFEAIDEENVITLYKQTIITMLDRLNIDGLLEAVHLVVALAREPDLCIKNTKEDKLCQKEGLPTAVEQSNSARMDAGKGSIPLDATQEQDR